jgi:hypothetical protein
VSERRERGVNFWIELLGFLQDLQEESEEGEGTSMLNAHSDIITSIIEL